MLWLLVRVLTLCAVWVFAIVWFAAHNLMAAEIVMNGVLVLGMAGYFAWSSYQWKRNSAPGRERSSESRESIRQLLSSVSHIPIIAAKEESRKREAAGIPTRMPLDYLQPEPQKLFEVLAGEDVYIDFSDVRVDLEGCTWVDHDARIRPEASFMSVKIRLAEGGYVLTLVKREGAKFKFTPRRLFCPESYAPVVRVVEEG